MENEEELREEEKKETNWHLIIGLMLVGLAVMALGYYFVVRDLLVKDYSSFAKCLSQKGFVMYGRDSCSYCQEVKKVFGESFRYINYVDCDVTPDVCVDVGVVAVPAWTFNNTMYIGINLSHFSELSGCHYET